MIILLNGSAQSGKNTFVDFCREFTSKRIWHLSTIDKVKDFCYDMYGIKYWEKTEENRKLWHETKMKYKDFLFWDMGKDLELFNINSIVFLDVREPDEIQRYIDHYTQFEFITLLITRPNLGVPNNNADKQVLHFKYDQIIDNNGSLAKLKQNAKIFMENL